MIHKLRKRFIRIATLSVALVMLLLTLILNVSNIISVDRDLTTMLTLIYENEGKIPDQHHSGGPGKQPKGPITMESPYATRYFLIRYNEKGDVVFSDLSHIASVTKEDLPQYTSALLKKGSGFGYLGGFKYYAVKEGEGRYQAIFLDCYREMRVVKNVALWSLFADVVCIALVFGLVTLFSRRAIDPVVRSTEKQKQFITDASHELKTPITVIATCLTVLEMEVGEQKWIRKAQGQTKKLTDLVNDLVALARMDEEKPNLTMARFDYSRVVSETVEEFHDPALAAGHDLIPDITAGIHLHGDETALRQLLSILLDNAIKYATPEGDIHIRLKTEHRRCLLTVSNPCAPILEEERKKLFDRFYRPDQSRTAATGGFGVGLSLAHSIVEIHRGSIQVQCPKEDLIEFVVSLKL